MIQVLASVLGMGISAFDIYHQHNSSENGISSSLISLMEEERRGLSQKLAPVALRHVHIELLAALHGILACSYDLQ